MKNQPDLLKDYATTVTILEHLSDAIFILNAEGQIEYANKVALDLLRTGLPAMIGQRLDRFLIFKDENDLWGGDDRWQLFLRKIYQQPSNEIEVSIASNQYHTPVVISFGLVRKNSGEVNFIIASAKDITIRTEFERDLQHQQLLNFSRDRFRELGEQAVNMVHNLSQPLTSIRLMVELTQKIMRKPNIEADQVNKNLTSIISSVDSMTTSITNVRNFAFQTEDDSLKLVDITLSVTNALRQFDYELTDKNITVEINQHDAMPLILANPIHLQRVFVSLIKILKSGLTHHAAPNEAKKIFIDLDNVDNKWLSVQVYSTLKNKPSAADIKFDSAERPQLSHQNGDIEMEMSIIQLIITTLGGDIRSQHSGNQAWEFALRLPVDQEEERAQLFNLIELLRQ